MVVIPESRHAKLAKIIELATVVVMVRAAGEVAPAPDPVLALTPKALTLS